MKQSLFKRQIRDFIKREYKGYLEYSKFADYKEPVSTEIETAKVTEKKTKMLPK